MTPDRLGTKFLRTGGVIATLAIGSLGAAGCGGTDTGITFTSNATPIAISTETPVPGPATATPSQNLNLHINSGDCVTLQPGQIYIIGGDVLINGSQPFDDIKETATEYLIQGDQPTPICAPYGAEEYIVPNDPNAIAAEEEVVYQGLRRTGCGTGNGCTSGVQFITVDNGQIQSTVLKTGNTFSS